MTTIYDVAQLANVSPATVSRVLNGGRTSPKSISAVMAAVQELDFVPNRNARRLRTRASELIAMLVPDIANSFYTTIVRAVEDIARSRGYAVMICNTDEDPVKEAEYLKAVISEPVAGIISAPVNAQTDYSLAELHRVPVVTIDRTARLTSLDSVIIDNVQGARDAVLALASHGYRDIACITGPPGTETADNRAEGWRRGVWDAFEKNARPDLLVRTSYTIDGGISAVRELLALDSPPDAIFAANNRLTVGALRELARASIHPPEMGIFSFGELPFILDPPAGILVAGMPMREMGSHAAHMLMERIESSAAPTKSIVLPPTIETEFATAPPTIHSVTA